mmetsp:Transcript_38938/g.77298  ORF Transcript_38938/g.77298 Transcript_38938/m.77298 type:complete len:140 (+) Transcript_38938:503-922(+)
MLHSTQSPRGPAFDAAAIAAFSALLLARPQLSPESVGSLEALVPRIASSGAIANVDPRPYLPSCLDPNEMAVGATARMYDTNGLKKAQLPLLLHCQAEKNAMEAAATDTIVGLLFLICPFPEFLQFLEEGKRGANPVQM